MSNAEKPDDLPFLSRWSKKKTEASEVTHDNSNAPESGRETNANTSIGAPFGAKSTENPHPETISPIHERKEVSAPAELPPIDSLTHESDFTGFMGKDVEPGLRNQAMKKLFTDPHYQFEQMDKLDIYLDDYSKSDPIPPDMLRRMYQSKSLFLFEDEEKERAANEAAGQIAAGAKSADQMTDSIEQIGEAERQVLPDVLPERAELISGENAATGDPLRPKAALAMVKPATP